MKFGQDAQNPDRKGIWFRDDSRNWRDAFPKICQVHFISPDVSCIARNLLLLLSSADDCSSRQALSTLDPCRGSEYLKKLAEELEKASVANPDQIPADVINLNSRARLEDQATKEEMIYTLVFPDDADVSQGKIPFLAPIGTAIQGYKTGDTFEWDTPGGTRTLQLKEILYQPEASGDER